MPSSSVDPQNHFKTELETRSMLVLRGQTQSTGQEDHVMIHGQTWAANRRHTAPGR